MMKLIAMVIVWVAMAQAGSLTFGAASSDRVDFGSAAAQDAHTAWSFCMWLRPTTVTGMVNLFSKQTTSGTGHSVYQTDAGIGGYTSRSTGYDERITNNILTGNTWTFIAVTYDTTSKVHIYSGGLTTAVSEPTYSVDDQAGSGSATNDDATNAIVGNDPFLVASFVGEIAWVGLWNRTLTLGEVRAQQFRPRVTSGSVIFSWFGYVATGNQPNWSGNAAGTVTGATYSAIGLPLGSIYAQLWRSLGGWWPEA